MFLVRHAERADNSKDSPLSASGTERAARLAAMLEDAGITAIYTTEYRRTKETAAPLGRAVHVAPVVVSAADGDALAAEGARLGPARPRARRRPLEHRARSHPRARRRVARHHRRGGVRQPLHPDPAAGRRAAARPVAILMAAEKPAHLRGGLSTVEYFTFGFGSMIGVGWLVLMDDWLQRGGPGGGMLGFLFGGLLLIPIAHTYGRLVRRIQDAGAEIAYTEGVFPASISFAAGWTMILSYAIVCPWEAVATGNLLARVFPALEHVPALHDRRQPDLRAAARGRPRADRARRRGELPRHQAERRLPGRDDVRAAGDLRRLHAARLRARIGGEHAAALLARRAPAARGCRSSSSCRSSRTS